MVKNTTQPQSAKAKVRPLPGFLSVSLSPQVTKGSNSPCPGHIPACQGLGQSQGTRVLTGTAEKQKQNLEQTGRAKLADPPPDSFCPW